MATYALLKVREDEYQVTSPNCPDCGLKGITEVVGSYAVYQMHQGALVQDVLPNLSPSERERFISGICPDCWDAMFDFDSE